MLRVCVCIRGQAGETPAINASGVPWLDTFSTAPIYLNNHYPYFLTKEKEKEKQHPKF